jgi:hypothetical protein
VTAARQRCGQETGNGGAAKAKKTKKRARPEGEGEGGDEGEGGGGAGRVTRRSNRCIAGGSYEHVWIDDNDEEARGRGRFQGMYSVECDGAHEAEAEAGPAVHSTTQLHSPRHALRFRLSRREPTSWVKRQPTTWLALFTWPSFRGLLVFL